MNKKYSLSSKRSAMALAVATGLSLTPMWADAAGLGRITVYSALGQPLRAEVQVSATKDELPGMTAQLAAAESFRQAGVEYSSTLNQLRFTVEKRPGGAVIKVSSERPINDPFLDFLLELNWPAGRLVREYTFLLDPPEVATQASRRQAVVEARTVPALSAGSEQGEVIARPAAAPVKPAEKPQATVPAEPRKAAEPAAPAPAPAAGGAGEHLVKPGETLRRIASENLPAGVSLEQMLVALYRNNADAFSGNNMNRLRAGAVLQMPSQEAAAAIPEAEARKVFRAQSSDWNNYRRKLAAAAEGTPVSDQAATRESGGKVSAKVEEKLPPAEQSKDQVKVSRSTQAAGKPGASEEDLIAKDKALKESQERLALLEKNVNELQKLLELKNQSLAEMQKQMAKPGLATPPAPAQPVSAPPAAPAPAEVKPEPKLAPLPELKPEVKSDAKPAEPAVEPAPAKEAEQAEAKPAEAAAPVEAPKPPAPKPAPKKPAPPPPPVEEPSFFDSIDLLPVAAGGGGIVAALLGYLFYRRRKAGIPSAAADQDTQTHLHDSTSTLGPNSVFQTAGGQSVDTSNTTPPSTDFSQAGPGAIDTDEVDPVAEADVYMAYGRDAQAEEILLDALQKDPQRTAIHSKLLEIYANRKSVKQFETLATELYAQTGGQGPEWDKVAAMGRNLDPANPLYGGSPAAAAPAAFAAAPVLPSSFDSEATLVVNSSEALAALTPAAKAEPEAEPSFDFVTEAPAAAPAPQVEDPLLALPEEAPAPVEELGVLDFDLETSASAPAPAAEAKEENFVDTVTHAELGDAGLDFDLAGTTPVDDTTSTAAGLDFSATVVNPEAAMDSLDFDLELDVGGTANVEPVAEPEVKPVQLSSMDTLVGEDFKAAVAQDAVPATEDSAGLLDFELNLSDAAAAPAVEAAEDDASAKTVVMSMDPLEPDEDMEFDVRLTDSTILGNPAGGGFDLSSIDLDLGGDAPAAAPAEAAAAPVEEAANPRRDEVNTKLDLAKAYEEMGDLEGARELLTEVLGEGAPDQVELAKSALDRLSA